MLDQNTSAQLKTLLERLESPIEIVASLNDSDKSDKIKELVTEIAALSDQVTARFDGSNSRLLPNDCQILEMGSRYKT